ncbi:transglycosylase SLT domain-containing protein [Streptomyces sp. BI20]|uniref:transglycosylase SLT domain-containing protein n=1 Tax=Streptomyces sp. BI20 TaxID=3403460 RepID=UPI003C7492F6
MATLDAAPVKVGAGYLDIYPQLDKTALTKIKSVLTSEMKAAGDEAGKGFSRSMATGMKGASQAAAAEAKKAQAAVQKEAVDSAAKLREIEASLTKYHGEQAGKQFMTYRDLALQREKLEEGTSAVTRAAIRDTLRANQMATQEAIALARKKAQEQERQERQAVAAAKERAREMIRLYTADLEAYRAEQAEKTKAAESAAAAQAKAAEAAAARARAAWVGAAKSSTAAFVGVGKSLHSNVIAPLALATAAAIGFGAKASDSFSQAASALHGIGVTAKDSATLLGKVQNLAINSTFSLKDMQEFAPQVSNVFMAHGKNSNQATTSAADLLQGVTDLAAKGGITDPTKLKTAMTQLTYVMDTGKITQQNIKPFEKATGVSAEQLAKWLGYEDKKNPKTGKMMDASGYLLADTKLGKAPPGMELINQIIKHGKDPNVVGRAKELQQATFAGDIQGRKEKAEVGLRGIFTKQRNDGTPILDKNGLPQLTATGKKLHALIKDVADLFQFRVQPILEKQAPIIIKLLDQFVQSAGDPSKLMYVKTFLGSYKASWAIFQKVFQGLEKVFTFVARLFGGDAADGGKALAYILGISAAFGTLSKVLGKLGLDKVLKATGKGLAAGTKRLFRKGDSDSDLPGERPGAGRRAGTTIREGVSSLGTRARVAGSMTGDFLSDKATAATDAVRDKAVAAASAVSSVRDRLREAASTSLEAVKGGLSSLRDRAGEAGPKLADMASKAKDLGAQALTGVREGMGTLKAEALNAWDATEGVRAKVSAVAQLNMDAVSGGFNQLRAYAANARDEAANVGSRVREVGSASLEAIKGQFAGLRERASGARDMASGVGDKVRSLGKISLDILTGAVGRLKDAFSHAGDKAGGLKGHISSIAEWVGIGKGRGGKKLATGGVLPGYAPGVDNIPAILSPGEAVLRPEVAHHLGADRINYWNAMAARGRLSRFASGTASAGGVGRIGPMRILDDLREALNFIDVTRAFNSGIGFMGASDQIGDPLGGGTRRFGGSATGDMMGRGINTRIGQAKEWVFNKLPDIFKEIPSGIGQIASVAAGPLVANAGKFFWDDVWKGQGNILQRGAQFSQDMFSPANILQAYKESAKGIWEMVKSTAKGAVEAIKDPIGAIKGLVSYFKKSITDLIDQFKSMFETFKTIFTDPLGYAKEIGSAVWDQVKENLPNTEGLFHFANGGVVPGYRPGVDSVHAMLSPGEAVLRPEAARALGLSTVAKLNKGEADAQAPGMTLPDADAYEAAVAAIKAALADLTSTTQSDWAAIGEAVRASVDGEITPAQTRWVQYLAGPLTQAEKGFQSANSSVWAGVRGEVNTSVTDVTSSFDRLRSNLGGLRDFFGAAADRIRQVWQSAMSFVDSSTRSTVSGPYNRGAVSMMANMAKLAGTGAPLSTVGFSTGGVVPGYQPGIDTVPAMLSKGEGVLRPEVVRALGASTIHAWNAAARRGGNVFANGGVVGAQSWSGQAGGDWVNKHQDDDYDGYTSALKAGWKAVVDPMLSTVRQVYGLAGSLASGGFSKALPWASAWSSWVDSHVGGGGAVVKAALDEYAKFAPSVGGAKYNQGNGESWCADFVSYIVDKAGANAQYGNSPHGAPGNRWPAVATWNGAMQHVPVSSSRPGDLLTYRGDGHINIKTGPDDTVGGNESNQLKHSRGYWRTATAALRPTGGESLSDLILNAWPGSIPKFTGTLGGGVDSAIGTAIAKAMGLSGVSGQSWADGIATIIRRESGGNASAVNNWDSNAAAGNASRGLMQVVPTTFSAYHQAGTSWDIFDPVANIAAAINYIRARYGDISRVQQADPNRPSKGYWTGTRSASQGLALVGERGPELVNFRGGERVFNNAETQGMFGPRYEIHIHEAKSEDTTQAVIRALKYTETMYGL